MWECACKNMSTNNGESCLGCLEHCKRTHGKTTQDLGLQSFFLVATSKEDFMNKLVFAIAKMIASCKENAIRLADPSGKQWKVELSQLSSTLPYIPLFILAYFYKEGNVLVFTHVEHALFSFKAFQKDGCVFHVSNSPDKSLKQEFLEEKQKQESCGNKKSERDIHKSDSVEVISNGVSLSGSEESHEQEEAEWQGMFEKKRGRVEVDCERERKKRTKMPEFRVTIKKKNIVNHYLNIPKEMGESLEQGGKAFVLIMMSGSQEWKVKLLRSCNSWMLSAGWRKLLEDHRMKVGDECVFSLVDPHKLAFKLEICRS